MNISLTSKCDLPQCDLLFCTPYIGASVNFMQSMYTIYENEMMIMIGVVLHLELNATVERDILVNLVLEESLLFEAEEKSGGFGV